MDTVIKTAFIYFILLVLLRLAGRRTLAEITTFDFVLLLIVGGATHRALLGQDYSVTNALLVVLTLVVIDVVLSLVELKSKVFAKLVNGSPMIVVEQGRPLHDRLRGARLTVDDVMASARRTHGIERLEEIKFAILEASGEISVIPSMRSAKP